MEGIRQYFRVPYPPGDAPKLHIGDVVHEVLDLSEQGVRFRVPEATEWKVGRAPIVARLVFKDGSTEEIQGEVRRKGEDFVALFLVIGVSLGRILGEQVRILRNYPYLLRPGEAPPSDDDGD